MKTVFIRHNLRATQETLQMLWEKRLIAVHYADIRSTKPEDYGDAGRKALKRLWGYCNEGVIVGAVFTPIKRIEMLVGEIVQGTKIEIAEYEGNIYKVVQLTKAKEISMLDYPLLRAIRPRQGTVTGWPSAAAYLTAIFQNKPIPRNVRSLAPSQLELVCYEYLRMRRGLRGLLLPIGRSLPDIDIFGIGVDGKNIVAQVTQSRSNGEISKKMDKLQAYRAGNTRLIFFGPSDNRVERQDIDYISVEEAFKEVEREYPIIITKMLGEILA